MTKAETIKSNIIQFDKMTKELTRLQKSVLGYERHKFRRDYFLVDMVKYHFYFYIDKYMKAKVVVNDKPVNACIGTVYKGWKFDEVISKLESLRKEIERCGE
jgi:hypothetical protein